MKSILPFIAGGLFCLSSFAQPEVEVKLASCRTEYRTHDSTDKPGFGIKLSLTPGKDISFLDTEALEPSITLIDANGRKIKPTTASVYPTENGKGKATAKFTFKQRPSGSKIRLEGTLKLKIASHVTVKTSIPVNLLAHTRVQPNVFPIDFEPDAANSARGNKEGDRLKRAVVRFRYPACVKILKIARQWEADDFPTVDSAVDYAQDVYFTTSKDKDEKIQIVEIHLVDVKPTAILTMATCTEKKEIEIPLCFDISLSEVVEIKEEK